MNQPSNKKSSVKKTIGFVLLCSFLFIGLNSFSQTTSKFTIRLTLTIHDGDYKNALITITKNGAPFRVIDPEGSIKSVDLDLNSNYLISCTKMGYISKDVALNTKVPDGRGADPFSKFKVVIELFPQPEDAIVKFSQAVGQIKYSIDINDFDYDKNYAATALEMQKQATEHPTPAPKPPPPPIPKPIPPPPPPSKPIEVSKPIPIIVKQKEEVHEQPSVKKKETSIVVPEKKSEKNSVEKIFQDDRKKTTIVIITLDGVDYIYKKEEFNWGGTYFYKNNVNITEGTYRSETE